MIATFFIIVLLTLIVNLFSPPVVRSVAFIALPPGSVASQNIQHLTIIDTASIDPPDSLPLKTFDFKATPTDEESIVALSVEAEGDFFDVVPKVADEWAAAAVGRLGPQAMVARAAGPSVLVRPNKIRNFVTGLFVGAMAAFYIATWREIFRQLDIREKLRGEPSRASDQSEYMKRRVARRRVGPRRTPWQRCEKIIRVSTAYGFLLSGLLTFFTPPTFESKAIIELPSGLSVSRTAAQLRKDADNVASDARPDFAIALEVTPVGDDSPEIAALTVLGSTQQPEAYSRLADAWAGCAVSQLGDGAQLLRHGEPAKIAVRPKRVQNILTGGLLGFIIGCVIAFIAEVKRLIQSRDLKHVAVSEAVTTRADVPRIEE